MCFHVYCRFLDIDEAKQALKELGVSTSDEDFLKLFRHLDTDNSGSLDWEEFKAMAKQAHIRNSVTDYIPLVGAGLDGTAEGTTLNWSRVA